MPGLKLRAALVTIAYVFVTGAAAAQTDRPGCVQDTSVLTCVTSAAMTLERASEHGVDVVVSVTLRITNTTDFPIDLVVPNTDFAFTPQNADTLTPTGSIQVSGLERCRYGECEYATVAPGRSALLQVRYYSEFDPPGLPLMQVARTASFSGALRINDRGATRTVPIAIDGFTFGNGLSRAR